MNHFTSFRATKKAITNNAKKSFNTLNNTISRKQSTLRRFNKYDTGVGTLISNRLFFVQKHKASITFIPAKTVRYKTTSANETEDNVAVEFYEGPVGPLITPLKVMSISTAALSLTGLPLALYMKSGVMPLSSQLAFGGITMFTSVGTTLALHFIFAPYVYTLEKISKASLSIGNQDADGDANDNATTNMSTSQQPQEGLIPQKKQNDRVDGTEIDDDDVLLKATMRNLFVMKKEIVFDPKTDVTGYDGFRPFCNFVAKGVPLYIHPELIYDDKLLTMLIPSLAINQQPLPPSSLKNEKKEVRDD